MECIQVAQVGTQWRTLVNVLTNLLGPTISLLRKTLPQVLLSCVGDGLAMSRSPSKESCHCFRIKYERERIVEPNSLTA